MEKAFKCYETVKIYPEFQLGPLNLELETGTVLGYIGPNGSGKTTTLHCLTGLVKADSGSIEIFGRENDPMKPEWKFDIGYVGDEHVFYERWSGEKNLKFISQFYPNWSNELAAALAKRFEVPLQKPAKELSKGNKVKLSLIAALAHSPKLLLFDEPTSGLDPVVRDDVLDVLFEVMETGERAIFYSTHILSDINRLADELAFIIDGRVVLRTAKDDLTDQWRTISFRLAEEHVQLDATVSIRKSGRDHQVVSYNSEKTLRQLKALGAENIRENRMSIDEIAVQILREKKMWKILKAEFRYYRYWLSVALLVHIVLLCIVAVVSFKNGKIEYKAIPVILFLMGDITFVVMMSLMFTREIARRRFHSLLPLSVRAIGISRLMFGVLFWIIMLILFGMTLLIVRLDTLVFIHKTFESNLLLDLLALNGCLFILNATYHILRDLDSCFARKLTLFTIPNDRIPGILLSLILFAAIIFQPILQLGPYEPSRTTILKTAVSPPGALILNLIGLGMLYLSVAVYERRRSFLT